MIDIINDNVKKQMFDNDVILNQADKVLDNVKGRIVLQPKFKNDYYEMLPK